MVMVMAKEKTIYECQKCGSQSPKWIGRCPECGEWSSMVETIVSAKKLQTSTFRRNPAKQAYPKLQKPLKLAEIKKKKLARIKTKIGEFDRVLGGGLVPGSVILLAGEPGIGKSTLLTQLVAKLGGLPAQAGLFVSGEESPEQVKMRTKRLKLKEEKFFVLPETNVDAIIKIIEDISSTGLSLVVIDSIQSMTSARLTGSPGTIGQVRESANQLAGLAKKKRFPLFLVGHITKSGAIAGPKVLEHLVDVVLYLEGDKRGDFRILRSYKNRFGPTDEVGVFEMKEGGMKEVANPSQVFLKERVKKVPGSVVVSTLKGARPVLVEIQALVVPTTLANPRRVASGVPHRRLQLLGAVLAKRCRLPLNKYDVYLNVAGGLKIDEPAADLGICLSIASSLKNKTAPQKAVFIGEVGLLGEIRPVRQLAKRIKEAKKLGFKKAITPKKYKSIVKVIKKFLK